MDLSSLVNYFDNKDLSSLNKYAPLLSSKTERGRYFPPYIPLVGKDYEKFKILLYATAQNLPLKSRLVKLYSYSDHFNKLVERLYYFWDVEHGKVTGKYPEYPLKYSEINVAPYQGGILPAMAGIYIYATCKEKIENLNEIQDLIAVSNYYKFSLYDNKNINPDELESADDYWKLNDELVLRELEILSPNTILTFHGRHVEFLKNKGFHVEIINEPVGIFKGSRIGLALEDSWETLAAKVKEPEILALLERYADNLQYQPYEGKKKTIKAYLLKNYLDWQKQSF